MGIAWVVSYIALWVLAVLLVIVALGMLRQIGVLQQSVGIRSVGQAEKPSIEEDGPPVGSGLPELSGGSVNGLATVSFAELTRRGEVLLLFMSPLCEGCQHVVHALNELADAGPGVPQPVVIMRSDQQGCAAFLSVFPLHMPVICDEERTLTRAFDVHRTPFGLLYDECGVLVRKGTASAEEDLRALLGDPTAPQLALAHVFPPVRANGEAPQVGAKP